MAVSFGMSSRAFVLLRPGRFDRHIVIDRPGWKERKAILEIHVGGKVPADNINFETPARGTPGMTGADLENLTNEAALALQRADGLPHGPGDPEDDHR
jgi:cell division protease FtsH